MLQLLCHLTGDYLLQTSWMANNKTKSWIAAITHACVYQLPFWFVLHPSPLALLVIFGTHAVIDRFRLAKLWCKATGSDGGPDWLSVWLMIITDNTIHLWINYLSLEYL